MMELKINGKEYNVIVLESEEEKIKGLQDVIELEDDEGALFVYDHPQLLEFWMHDTDIPLDIIFISEDWVVNSVHKGIPRSTEILSDPNSQYVLEINQNSGIEAGMEVNTDDDLEVNSMYVMGSDGKPQMELDGEERIFSRPNTKTLIRMAKRAYSSNKDSDYKKLGKKVFEFLEIQNNNESEYVEK